MNASLTRRTRILQFIGEYTAHHGIAPSVRDIESAVGLKTPSAVLYHLRALEKAGKLHRLPYLSRSITLLPRKKK
jgi:repressor LexA